MSVALSFPLALETVNEVRAKPVHAVRPGDHSELTALIQARVKSGDDNCWLVALYMVCS